MAGNYGLGHGFDTADYASVPTVTPSIDETHPLRSTLQILPTFSWHVHMFLYTFMFSRVRFHLLVSSLCVFIHFAYIFEPPLTTNTKQNIYSVSF